MRYGMSFDTSWMDPLASAFVSVALTYQLFLKWVIIQYIPTISLPLGFFPSQMCSPTLSFMKTFKVVLHTQWGYNKYQCLMWLLLVLSFIQQIFVEHEHEHYSAVCIIFKKGRAYNTHDFSPYALMGLQKASIQNLILPIMLQQLLRFYKTKFIALTCHPRPSVILTFPTTSVFLPLAVLKL